MRIKTTFTPKDYISGAFTMRAAAIRHSIPVDDNLLEGVERVLAGVAAAIYLNPTKVIRICSVLVRPEIYDITDRPINPRLLVHEWIHMILSANDDHDVYCLPMWIERHVATEWKVDAYGEDLHEDVIYKLQCTRLAWVHWLYEVVHTERELLARRVFAPRRLAGSLE